MKFSEYLEGILSEYTPHLRAAALDVAMSKLSSVDQALRNPKKLGDVLTDVLDGIAETWRACPHGTPAGEHCAKCEPRKLGP